MSNTHAGRLVIPFEELRMTDVEVVGGKNASLGELISQLSASGVQVPGGFATTADAFRDFLDHNRLTERINARLATLNTDDVKALAQAGAEIRSWVSEAAFPPDLEKAIREHFARLTKDSPAGVSFAVRSSATAEDLPDASFAGQQETVLNVVGIDAILDDGTRQLFGPFGERSSVSLNSGRAGQLVSSLFGIAAGVQADMARHWPPGQRVPDGYLLDAFHPRPQRPYTPDGSVNLAHLLAGSAGTLAWSARLHLRLLRRPAVSRWALFLQSSAAAALTHAPAVLALQPSAALLLDAADLRRLLGSRHPDDQALCRLAGIGPGMSGRPDGTQRGEVGAAAWLVRFSGEADADV